MRLICLRSVTDRHFTMNMLNKILIIALYSIIYCEETLAYTRIPETTTQATESVNAYQSAVDYMKSLFASRKIENFFEEQGNKVGNTFSAFGNDINAWGRKFDTVIKKQITSIGSTAENYLHTLKEKSDNLFGWKNENPEPQDKVENPDCILTVASIISNYGYICETHTILSDGYVLNMHRIPRPKNGDRVSSKTIVLQHGMFSSSAEWIIAGPGKALGYVLADHGYDVWMLNVRGNKYSNEHVSLKKDSFSYWNYTWHDIASQDVPKAIDYILKIKGSNTKISYIGHSMGTTILFAMLALRPEYNNILNLGFALSPVVFLKDIKSPLLKSLAPLGNVVARMQFLQGSYEFAPNLFSCEVINIDNQFCQHLTAHISGFNETHFNKDLLPIIRAHSEKGASWKMIIHYAQLVLSGRFQHFDYGSQNLELYGTNEPPQYYLSNISVPIVVLYSDNDILSSKKDIELLRETAPAAVREVHRITSSDFGHHDYLSSLDSPTLLNTKILEILNFSTVYSQSVPFSFD